MAAPVDLVTSGHIRSVRKSMPKLVPIEFKIVPTNSDANRPKAMAPSASIK